MNPENKYYKVYKPYNMVSQFVSNDDVPLLGGLNFPFPSGIHAIGRLDKFSEGLLLMTTNKQITRLLFDPSKTHERVYRVLVKGIVTAETLDRIGAGIEIEVERGNRYTAVPKKISLAPAPLFEFFPLDQSKAFGPSTWLEMTLTEGKYHQVRKMVYAVGHKCLRLIRFSIMHITIEGLAPGAVQEITEHDFFERLSLVMAP